MTTMTRQPLLRRKALRTSRCVRALALLLLATGTTSIHAAYLYNGFLDPTIAPINLQTQYSGWNTDGNKFYALNGNPNSPTSAAPYGNPTTASAAGVPYPGLPTPWSLTDRIWSMPDPTAFFDPRNPTITQTGARSMLVTGIYSFAGVTNFSLKGSTDYDLGTIIFQFETFGTPVDYSSIQLKYNDGTGIQIVNPSELIKEYAGDSSGFGGLNTRVALQFQLSGKQIQNYEIVWNSAGSSMSFVTALLDTSADYKTVVAGSGKWTGGSGLWSNNAQWTQNAVNLNYAPQANGNVTFSNATAATVDLDIDQTVGEIVFNTAADTTLKSTLGRTLTVNTGVTTTSQATGTYTFEGAYATNSTSLFDIGGGKVVMKGVISGAYGLVKDGAGVLELTGNNVFSGTLTVNGGTLRITGTNTYSGVTSVNIGNLIVAGDVGATGALGNTTSGISIGADSSLLSGNLPAGLFIEGNHTISRTIIFNGGTFQKVLGATLAPQGATFSGNVLFGSSTDIRFNTAQATDKLNFTGGISGPANAGMVVIDGPGVVTYGGANKTYSYGNATNIAAGTLKIDPTAIFDTAGKVTVGTGAQLLVHGTLNGAGTLEVNGGTVGGAGTINRAIALDTGDVLAPGDGVGTLHTVGETWGAGARLQLEINDSDLGAGLGWDTVAITGKLDLTATPSGKFKLELYSLTTQNAAGQIADFNYNVSRSWIFATATDGFTGFDASAFEIDLSHFQNALNGSFSQFSVAMSGDGKSLSVEYLAVPEPSSSVLALCGSLFFLNRRRRASQRR